MSFVQSAVEFERRCEFSKLWYGHAIDARKLTKALLLAMALELYLLKCKFGSVAYCGHPTKSQSFIFGDSNWKFCSQLPHRHTKTWHSDADISALGFLFYAFIFEWKNLNLLDIQEHCICKLGKTQSELKHLFVVYYWFLKLYTRIIWHSYFPSHGIL